MTTENHTYGLTPKQYDLLVFINDYICDYQFSPSYDEMIDAMGLLSKSGIHRIVKSLSNRGMINYIPSLARSIGLTSKGKRVVSKNRSPVGDDKSNALSALCKDDTIKAALIEIASNGEITITSSAEADEEFLAILTVIQDAIPQYIKELAQ